MDELLTQLRLEPDMEMMETGAWGGVIAIGSQVFVCRDCRFVFGDRRPEPCPVCHGTDFDDLAMG